jgi:hypothetical protein
MNDNQITAIAEAADYDGTPKKTVIQSDLKRGSPQIREQEFNGQNNAIVVGPVNGLVYFIDSMGLKSSLYQSETVPISRQKILDLPLDDWQIEVLNGQQIALSTSPQENTGGYLYLVNSSVSTKKRVLAATPNLEARVSPDGSKAIYSTIRDNDTVLILYHIDTNLYIDLAAPTFAEKCTWSNDSKFIYCAVPKTKLSGSSLQDWHRGDISFSDHFIAVDASTGEIKELFDPEVTGNKIDALNMTYAGKFSGVFFTNKHNLHTYILEVN